jgi:hypothetical protein
MLNEMEKAADMTSSYEYCGDKTVNNVVYKHIKRAISSNIKHKNTISDREESSKQWVQEALEESMDMSVYLQRLLEKIEHENNLISELIVDLGWEIDRMSSSGRETLEALFNLLGIKGEESI